MGGVFVDSWWWEDSKVSAQTLHIFKMYFFQFNWNNCNDTCSWTPKCFVLNHDAWAGSNFRTEIFLMFWHSCSLAVLWYRCSCKPCPGTAPWHQEEIKHWWRQAEMLGFFCLCSGQKCGVPLPVWFASLLLVSVVQVANLVGLGS